MAGMMARDTAEFEPDHFRAHAVREAGRAAHPAISRVRAQLLETSQLRAKILVLEWPADVRERASAVIQGLDRALALYAAIPGPPALRIVNYWTHEALQLLVDAGSDATLRL